MESSHHSDPSGWSLLARCYDLEGAIVFPEWLSVHFVGEDDAILVHRRVDLSD